MNWFTKRYLSTKTLGEKKAAIAEEGACKHVKKNNEIAYAQRMEMDSFGPVSSYVVCKNCDDKAEAKALVAPTRCHDCQKDVPFKDGKEYRGYGFDRRQGDVELFICNVCQTLSKHQSRLSEDRRQAALDAEYDDDYDDDD